MKNLTKYSALTKWFDNIKYSKNPFLIQAEIKKIGHEKIYFFCPIFCFFGYAFELFYCKDDLAGADTAIKKLVSLICARYGENLENSWLNTTARNHRPNVPNKA